MLNLYPHQIDVINKTKNYNRCAYYLDMGLGKTFVGSEKLKKLSERINVIVCQKSKVNDWIEHVKEYYNCSVFNLTTKKELDNFINCCFCHYPVCDDFLVGIINYDLIWRRPQISSLSGFSLLLDESSMIANETSNRAKFVLKMTPDNIILLSGTPTDGKYEKLWSQCQLLGWKISKSAFWDRYVKYRLVNDGFVFYKDVYGYKNVDELKEKLREHGCVFMKTDEVMDLPKQNFQKINCENSKEYRKFHKNKYIVVEGDELVGNTSLKQLLYERQLCGCYSKEKLSAFKDLLQSTSDRLIVFYNFNKELEQLTHIALSEKRKVSVVNGKEKNLTAYENTPNSVTFIQYQAGSMGLNLQKANKIVYYTLPLKSEYFEQSKKRIHRIGQDKPCFYYIMICKETVEEKIYETLKMRKDYTDALFVEENNAKV